MNKHFVRIFNSWIAVLAKNTKMKSTTNKNDFKVSYIKVLYSSMRYIFARSYITLHLSYFYKETRLFPVPGSGYAGPASCLCAACGASCRGGASAQGAGGAWARHTGAGGGGRTVHTGGTQVSLRFSCIIVYCSFNIYCILEMVINDMEQRVWPQVLTTFNTALSRVTFCPELLPFSRVTTLPRAIALFQSYCPFPELQPFAELQPFPELWPPVLGAVVMSFCLFYCTTCLPLPTLHVKKGNENDTTILNLDYKISHFN